MVHSVLGDSSTQSQKGAPNLPMLTIPSPPALEREGQSSPVSQESGLQVPESQNTAMESGGLFPGCGGQGADLSVQSIGSGASERAREQSLPPNMGLAPSFWHVQQLEFKVETLQDSLPPSFSLVRDELDKVWKELGNLWTITSSPLHQESATPPLFHGRPHDAVPTSLRATFLPASFQHLMRQVVDELRTAGFVLRTDPDARGNSGVQSDMLDQTLDQVTALSRRLNGLENFFKVERV